MLRPSNAPINADCVSNNYINIIIVTLCSCGCSYMNYYEQYSEFDAFITSPEPSNPWISDNVEFWEQELTTYVSLQFSYANVC